MNANFITPALNSVSYDIISAAYHQYRSIHLQALKEKVDHVLKQSGENEYLYLRITTAGSESKNNSLLSCESVTLHKPMDPKVSDNRFYMNQDTHRGDYDLAIQIIEASAYYQKGRVENIKSPGFYD